MASTGRTQRSTQMSRRSGARDRVTKTVRRVQKGPKGAGRLHTRSAASRRPRTMLGDAAQALKMGSVVAPAPPMVRVGAAMGSVALQMADQVMRTRMGPKKSVRRKVRPKYRM